MAFDSGCRTSFSGELTTSNWSACRERNRLLRGHAEGVLFRPDLHGRISGQRERQGSSSASTIELLAQISSWPAMTLLASISS
jgi:hypothetical protein